MKQNSRKKIKSKVKMKRTAKGLFNYINQRAILRKKSIGDIFNKDYYGLNDTVNQNRLLLKKDDLNVDFTTQKIKPNIDKSIIDSNCKNYRKKNFSKNDALNELLEKIKKDYSISEYHTFQPKITLIPYSVEELQFFSGYDVVNSHSLDAESFNTINEKLFNTTGLDYKTFADDFIKKKIQSDDLSQSVELVKDAILSTTHNPIKFLEFLLKNIKTDNLNKATFIVSHSNFMSKFTKLLLEKLNDFNKDFKKQKPKAVALYNNLDILHIGIKYNDTNNMFEILILNVYRSQQFFKNIETPIVDNDNSIKHIFLMRHCFACHNTIEGINRKALQLKNNYYDSGYYSSCLPEYINAVLSEKGSKNILDIFQKYGININEIMFGSSIIFRAITTCYILQFYLNKNLSSYDSNSDIVSDDEYSVRTDSDEISPIQRTSTTMGMGKTQRKKKRKITPRAKRRFKKTVTNIIDSINKIKTRRRLRKKK